MNSEQAANGGPYDGWLEAVESLGPMLREHAEENERLRRLAPAVVDALHERDLFSIFSPPEVGGANIGPDGHIEVIAALTAHDGSTGWCVMIGAHESAWLASRLPDAGIERVFSGPRWPVTAGQPFPGGRAEPVDGGWRISGRWGWGSGIHHADWVIAQATLPDESGGESAEPSPPELLTVAAPSEQVVVEDTWRVAGMQGTGSNHYRLEDAFIGEELRLQPFEQPLLRGDGWLARPTLTFLCPAAYGIALGLAERAVEEATALAASRVRLGARAPLAERETFQRELGELVMTTRAIRSHGLQFFRELADAPVRGVSDAVRMDDTARSASAWATRTAESVIRAAHRAAGGDAVFLEHPLQRLLRDVQTATQHVVVSDAAFQRLGRHTLGLPVRPGL